MSVLNQTSFTTNPPDSDSRDKTILAQQALIDKQQNDYAALQTQFKEQQEACTVAQQKYQSLRDDILSLLRNA